MSEPKVVAHVLIMPGTPSPTELERMRQVWDEVVGTPAIIVADGAYLLEALDNGTLRHPQASPELEYRVAALLEAAKTDEH